MFSKNFYRSLRDDFDDHIQGTGREPVLIGFLREEKKQDSRIRNRQTLIRLSRAENPGVLRECLDEVLGFIGQGSTLLEGRPEEEERLRALLGLGKDVPLRKAVKERRDEIDGFFAEHDVEMLNRQKQGFVEAGKLFTGLLDRKGAQRKNPCIALWETYLDYRLGERTRDDVLKACRSIYETKYRVSDKKIRAVLKAKEGLVNEEMLEKVVGLLSESILREEAKALLYDVGFPLPDREMPEKDGEYPANHGKSGGEKEKKAGRKKDRVMNLIDYCEKAGLNVSVNGIQSGGNEDADNPEDFKEAANELWTAMVMSRERGLKGEEVYNKAIVPLKIDRKSGVGMYIIGRDLVSGNGSPGAGEYGCYFVVLEPDEINPKPLSEKSRQYGGQAKKQGEWQEEAEYMLRERLMLLQYKFHVFDNVKDAYDEYEFIRNDFEFYKYSNGDPPMKDVDERFRCYFDPVETEDEPDTETIRKRLDDERAAFHIENGSQNKSCPRRHNGSSRKA